MWRYLGRQATEGDTSDREDAADVGTSSEDHEIGDEEAGTRMTMMRTVRTP